MYDNLKNIYIVFIGKIWSLLEFLALILQLVLFLCWIYVMAGVVVGDIIWLWSINFTVEFKCQEAMDIPDSVTQMPL